MKNIVCWLLEEGLIIVATSYGFSRQCPTSLEPPMEIGTCQSGRFQLSRDKWDDANQGL